ncbi:UNVERIFIED_CONTAM: Beta carbonic anhydrase 5, chloroplastic [Sesamum latifolium]|uniref:Beta carbonic anhydrase 5, chloroplastic n=1 Tax=Sesamum latifolium TaxID=2727402 RepID=A0AAW2V1J5_9LAMI
MAQAVLQSSYLSGSSSMDRYRTSVKASDIFGSQLRSPEIEQTHLRFLGSFKRNPTIRLKALRESPGLAQEIIDDKVKIAEVKEAPNHFKELKHRFLGFKKDKYLKDLEHYQRLSDAQAPKESINRSLLNLLTYPWIEERVIRGKLSIHGGYYDFIDCTFEKWTLDYKGSGLLSSAEYSIKNREFWA